MNFASGSNLPKCPAADCDATPNFCDLQKILTVEIALQFVIALCHKSCWFYNLLYTMLACSTTQHFMAKHKLHVHCTYCTHGENISEILIHCFQT